MAQLLHMKIARDSFKAAYTCLLCCLISIGAFSQSGKINITGTVSDSLHRPLGFTTVSLYKSKHSASPFKNTYTKENGRFEIMADSGIYKIGFSHTGYTNKLIELKNENNTNLDLGEVVLAPASTTLERVTVTAVKPLVEQNNDKIVYNAENDPAAKTETASDILRKTPLVTVDGDGNVQVNGQSNFKVLLNGRETSMFAQNLKDALKGFPGALISKVEVITSPSAKYDAEGVGGIINIITKKRVIGYNGFISSYGGTTGNYSESINLSAKLGKTGFSGFYGLNGMNNQPGTSLLTTSPLVPSVYSKRTLAGDRSSGYFSNYGNFEASLEADSLNTITLYANFGGGYNESSLARQITTEYSSQPDDLAH